MIRMIKWMLRPSMSRQTIANRSGAEIVRRWVETGDERCPLACVWFALPEIATDQDDESESRQPAFFSFPSKAGCLRSLHILLAPSTLWLNP